MSLERENKRLAAEFDMTDVKQVRLRAHERVSHATEDEADLVSIGNEIQFGVLLSLQSNPQVRQIGEGIFSQIGVYFNQNQFIWKYAYPKYVNPNDGIESLREVVKSIERYPVENFPRLIQWYVANAKSVIDRSEKQKKVFGRYVNYAFFIKNELDVHRSDEITDYMLSYPGKIAETLMKYEMSDLMLSNELPLVDKIYTFAKESHDNRLRGVPDVYTTKFNGVSLRDLEEKDGKKFVMSAMKFITGVPKGDAFWDLIKRNLFYEYPNHEMRFALAREKSMYSELSRKFLSFQSYISKRILYPAFLPGYDDLEFDKAFKRMIDVSSKRELELLGMACFLHAIRYKEFEELQLREFDIRISSDQPDLNEIPLLSYRPSVLFDDPYIMYDLQKQAFYYGFEHIRDNFFTRFGSTEKAQEVMASFHKSLGKGMELEEYANDIKLAIERNIPQIGKKFQNLLSKDTMMDTREYKTAETRVEHDGHNEVLSEITFEKPTILDEIGFGNVTVSIDPAGKQSYIVFENTAEDIRFLGVRDLESLRLFPSQIYNPTVTELVRNIARIIIDNEIRKNKEIHNQTITPRRANEIFMQIFDKKEDPS